VRRYSLKVEWKGDIVVPRMRISLFGGPRIEHDGSDIEVGTRKAIALLAYLAVTRRPAGTTL
jgi:hypothetical protein